MDLSSRIVACGDLAVAVALSASAAAQQAQRRFVVVHGQRLTDLQVMEFEALDCSPFANGRFGYERCA